MQATDSNTYLDMELLRFTTAGSVDDGKSTLIGRLLYDSKSIFEDQLEAVEESSRRRGDENVNLALLTDGLRAEREQGITIDVAYRYFATPKRKFIIADTPGHIQYTRNMVTGASTANLAVILIDARHGVVEQTCRHTYIAHSLGIPHVAFCVNKMDLADYDEGVYNSIKAEVTAFAEKLGVKEFEVFPISALYGDNVVNESEKMPWYQGPTLLGHLENVELSGDRNYEDQRFPVQTVIRPHSDEFHDFRGFAGRVSGGVFHPGDEVTVLPSGLTTKVKAIVSMGGDLEEAFPPMSVTLTLEDEIDISRGGMIVGTENLPESVREFEATLCWMSEQPMTPRTKYVIRHTSNEARCMVTEVVNKVNINTLDLIEDDKSVKVNDIVRVKLKTTNPLFVDSYHRNRETGSFIIIDESTNVTVGAGMVI
ncbi:sulfate adenylyltransferase subunit 1 [Fulvitalea axinellae]|uniref:sulfate adenylyltransferase n=1 Tax=Fulvitalea axinellae TaxID=1182444 RepID=A0AAU9CVF3_9BACT|nr:sulfate adenylyltransferase subunit 1 [Fulvitalea axinellae]